MHALRRVRLGIEWLGMAMNYVAGWCYVLCAVFITLDVIGRSTIGISSKTTVEITGYMLAFGIAWALAHTLARRCHIRVDVLVNRMPARIRQPLHALAVLILAGFAVFVAWVAWGLVDESRLFDAHDTSALSIPLVLPQGLWLFGIVVFTALAVVMSLEVVLRLLAGQGAEVDRLLGPRTIDDETEEALEAVAMAREST